MILKLILNDAEIPQYPTYHDNDKPIGSIKDKQDYDNTVNVDANATAIANANANANVQVIFIQKDAKDWTYKTDERNTVDYWYNKYIHPETNNNYVDNDGNKQRQNKYETETDADAVANAEANVTLVLIIGDDDEAIPEYKMYQNNGDNEDSKHAMTRMYHLHQVMKQLKRIQMPMQMQKLMQM